MTREFVYTESFRKCWKAMGLSDGDLKILEEILLTNPRLGDAIEGTGGTWKIRIQMENCGKSGGARVIYVDVFEKEKLYLLLAYPKNVQDDLTPEQRKQVRKLVEAIKKE